MFTDVVLLPQEPGRVAGPYLPRRDIISDYGSHAYKGTLFDRYSGAYAGARAYCNIILDDGMLPQPFVAWRVTIIRKRNPWADKTVLAYFHTLGYKAVKPDAGVVANFNVLANLREHADRYSAP